MTDPFLVAARKVVTECFDELRRSVDGLPGPRSIGVRPERTPTRLPYSSPTQ